MRYLVIEVRPDEDNKVIYIYDNQDDAAQCTANLNRLSDYSYIVCEESTLTRMEFLHIRGD